MWSCYYVGFGNHERRKKVHAPSAWLPEKEVAVCLTPFIQKSLSLLVLSFVTWREFMNDARISVGDISVIIGTINTLFTQLHTRDNCSSRGPRIVHHGKWIIHRAWCVECVIKVWEFSREPRKLFINAEISKNIHLLRENILKTHLNAIIKYVRNHSHLEYFPNI